MTRGCLYCNESVLDSVGLMFTNLLQASSAILVRMRLTVQTWNHLRRWPGAALELETLCYETVVSCIVEYWVHFEFEISKPGNATKFEVATTTVVPRHTSFPQLHVTFDWQKGPPRFARLGFRISPHSSDYHSYSDTMYRTRLT